MPESALLKPIRGRRVHANLKVDSPWAVTDERHFEAGVMA
jgi:hypothetical protein